MAYVLELDDEGLGVAVARDDDTEALEAAGYALEWIEADAQEPTKAPEKPAEAVQAPAPATPEPTAAEASVEVVAEEPTAAKGEGRGVLSEGVELDDEPVKRPRKRAKKGEGKAGRPTVGLTILVGAVPVRGSVMSRSVILSSEVLARFGAELAVDMNSESYYKLDSFKRRDRLAQKADYIVSELARMVLVHPGVLGNDDVGSLVQALMAQTEGVDAVFVRTA